MPNFRYFQITEPTGSSRISAVDEAALDSFLFAARDRGIAVSPVVAYDVRGPEDPITGRRPQTRRAFTPIQNRNRFVEDIAAKGYEVRGDVLGMPSPEWIAQREQAALAEGIRKKEGVRNDLPLSPPTPAMSPTFMRLRELTKEKQDLASAPVPQTPEGSKVRDRLVTRIDRKLDDAISETSKRGATRGWEVEEKTPFQAAIEGIPDDYVRARDSMANTVTSGVAGMVKGVIDANQIVRDIVGKTGLVPDQPEWSKKIEKRTIDFIDEFQQWAAKRNSEIETEVVRQYGVAPLVAQNIANAAMSTAVRLQIMKLATGGTPGSAARAGWKAMAKETAGQIAKLAVFSGLTTPGSVEDKALAAGNMAVYAATPIASSASPYVPLDLLAKVADFALNTTWSVANGSYLLAYEEAKQLAEKEGKPLGKRHLLATFTPVALQDLAFSALVKSAQRGNKDAYALATEIRKRTVDKDFAQRLYTELGDRIEDIGKPKPEQTKRAGPGDVLRYKVERLREEKAAIAKNPITQRDLLMGGVVKASAETPYEAKETVMLEPVAEPRQRGQVLKSFSELPSDFAQAEQTPLRRSAQTQQQKTTPLGESMPEEKIGIISEQPPREQVDAIQREVLKQSGIPDEKKADYVLDTVANGEALRKASESVATGKMTIEQAANKITHDYETKKKEVAPTAKMPEQKPLTVEEAADKGERIKPPKGATAVRVTDAKGRTGIIDVDDIDTLEGAGPYKSVEFGVRGKAGFVKMGEPGKVATPKAVVAELPKTEKLPELMPPAENTRQSDEVVKAAEGKSKKRTDMLNRQARTLEGKSIDTTGDLFEPGMSDEPLFAAPTPKPQPVPAQSEKSPLDASPSGEAAAETPIQPNKHGVLIGGERILIPLPKKLKIRTAMVEVAKAPDGKYRYGLQIEKASGSMDGMGSPASVNNAGFDTKQDAIRAAREEMAAWAERNAPEAVAYIRQKEPAKPVVAESATTETPPEERTFSRSAEPDLAYLRTVAVEQAKASGLKPEDAEDLAQDVMISFSQNYKPQEGKGPENYVRKAVSQRANTYKAKYVAESQTQISLQEEAGEGKTVEDTLVSEPVRSRNSMMDAESVRAKVAELPDTERRIIENRYYSDSPKTQQQMADELKISRRQVQDAEARAVDLLREALSEEVDRTISSSREQLKKTKAATQKGGFVRVPEPDPSLAVKTTNEDFNKRHAVTQEDRRSIWDTLKAVGNRIAETFYYDYPLVRDPKLTGKDVAEFNLSVSKHKTRVNNLKRNEAPAVTEALLEPMLRTTDVNGKTHTPIQKQKELSQLLDAADLYSRTQDLEAEGVEKPYGFTTGEAKAILDEVTAQVQPEVRQAFKNIQLLMKAKAVEFVQSGDLPESVLSKEFYWPYNVVDRLAHESGMSQEERARAHISRAPYTKKAGGTRRNRVHDVVKVMQQYIFRMGLMKEQRRFMEEIGNKYHVDSAAINDKSGVIVGAEDGYSVFRVNPDRLASARKNLLSSAFDKVVDVLKTRGQSDFTLFAEDMQEIREAFDAMIYGSRRAQKAFVVPESIAKRLERFYDISMTTPEYNAMQKTVRFLKRRVTTGLHLALGKFNVRNLFSGDLVFLATRGDPQALQYGLEAARMGAYIFKVGTKNYTTLQSLLSTHAVKPKALSDDKFKQYLDEAINNGVHAGQFVAEAQKESTAFIELETNPLREAYRRSIGSFIDMVDRIQAYREGWIRLAQYIYNRESGMGEAEAWQKTMDVFGNYGNVSPLFRDLFVNGIMPFANFPRITIEGDVKAVARGGKYRNRVIAYVLASQLGQQLWNYYVAEDDEERLQNSGKGTNRYLAENFHVQIPGVRDKAGNSMIVYTQLPSDLYGKILGVSDLVRDLRADAENYEGTEMAKEMVFSVGKAAAMLPVNSMRTLMEHYGGPIATATDLAYNRSYYYDRPIYSPTDNPGVKSAKMFMHVARSFERSIGEAQRWMNTDRPGWMRAANTLGITLTTPNTYDSFTNEELLAQQLFGRTIPNSRIPYELEPNEANGKNGAYSYLSRLSNMPEQYIRSSITDKNWTEVRNKFRVAFDRLERAASLERTQAVKDGMDGDKATKRIGVVYRAKLAAIARLIIKNPDIPMQDIVKETGYDD